MKLPKNEEIRLIRRTDEAPVLLPDGRIYEMRWGFRRKGIGVVNNTRTDKLDSPMWRESVEKRRCLIPVVSFYEWTGPKGRKQTHLFRSPTNRWLWMAGIWEDSQELGRCFSMLTTEANSLVSPIHHRMPAILSSSAEQTEYLEEGLGLFAPEPELLITELSANPLIKKPTGPVQDELF